MRERSKTYRTHLGCVVQQRKVLNEDMGRSELHITLSCPIELVREEGKTWPQPPKAQRGLTMSDFLIGGNQ